MELDLNCQKCGNTGYILKQITGTDGNHYTVAVECECNAKRKYITQAQSVGLGDSIFNKTFETFEATELWQQTIKQTALEFCNQNKQKMFYIGGQIGCGKTHICTAIINNLLERGLNCHYVIWNDVITRLKQNAYDNKTKYYEELDQLKYTEVLFIDDFFKNENATKADIDIAFQIINTRYINNLTTIISSERPLCYKDRNDSEAKTFKNSLELIDEAVASRICELTNAGKFNLSIAKDRNKNYRFRNVS